MIIKPKITIALAVNEKRHTLIVSRDDSTNVLNGLHRDLHDLEHEGYHAMCQRVGDVSMHMLARAHPDVFAQYPLLAPPKPPYDDPHQIVFSLMHRSIKEKTTDYAAAIEALFKRHADNPDLTSLAESWEEYKLTIEHYQKR
jgi:hypothetical protein